MPLTISEQPLEAADSSARGRNVGLIKWSRLLFRQNTIKPATAETKEYQLRRLHDAVYGTMISVESLKRGKFEDCSKLFIEIPSRQAALR